MREAIDPAVAAELAAVDAALAGEREDAEVAAILAEARAAATPMTPAFAERLDAAAARGFAPSRQRPVAAWRRPQLLAGLATAAAVLVALVVVLGSGSGNGAGAGPGPGAPEALSRAQGAVGAGASSSSSSAAGSAKTAPAPTPAGVDATASGTAAVRKVERGAQLTIAVPARRLQDAADRAAAVADRLGGFVARSDVSAGARSGQAEFDLRVPAGRLDHALADLSRLGHVRARSQQVQDVTASFTLARARLHDALAERAALLRALAVATTQPQIDSIHARLDLARRRIGQARGELRSVRRLTDMATIGLTILGVAHSGATGGHHGGGSWTPGRGARDALSVLSASAGLAIVALAAALPLALLALLAALAFRQLARRRREQALDAGAGGAAAV